jgi:hypothetical protein
MILFSLFHFACCAPIFRFNATTTGGRCDSACDGLCLCWITKLTDECKSFGRSIVVFADTRTFPFESAVFRDVIVDYSRLTRNVGAVGSEESEFIMMSAGAFSVRGPAPALQKKSVKRSLLIDRVWPNIQFNRPDDLCDVHISKPVVFVERYEYANVYHQFTDWLSAHVTDLVLRTTLLARERLHYDLFDLHTPSDLDTAWSAVFSPLRNSSLSVRALMRSRARVCYNILMLAPIGYHTRVATVAARPETHEISSTLHYQLARRFYYAFDKQNKLPAVMPSSTSLCVIIARRQYVAHPRNPHGEVHRQWRNESELLTVTRSLGLDCAMIDFARVSLAEQVNLMRRTRLLIGVHGAGLTMMLFMPRRAAVVEISVGPQYHFSSLARHTDKKYVVVSGEQSRTGLFTSVAQDRLRQALSSVLLDRHNSRRSDT